MNNWISLSQTAGTGNAVITVSPDANPSAITRSATIKISNGSITKTVYVSQRAAALAVTNIDIIGHDTYVIPYLGGSATTSNIRFNVRAYYNDGTSRDQVPATVTGNTVTAMTSLNLGTTPETAGTIHAVATFSGKSDSTDVTIYQQPVPEDHYMVFYSTGDINISQSGWSSGSSCNVARKYWVGGNGVIVFDNTVSVIPTSAFSGNDRLTSVWIPDSIVAISTGAFAYCNSATSLIYEGTVDDWNSVYKADGWYANSAIEVVHCSDGDVWVDDKLVSIYFAGVNVTPVSYTGGTVSMSTCNPYVKGVFRSGAEMHIGNGNLSFTANPVTISTVNTATTTTQAGTIQISASYSGASATTVLTATTNASIPQYPAPETNRIVYSASTPIVFTNDAINNFGSNIIASGYSNGSGAYIFDEPVERFYGNASCMITSATKGALTGIDVPSSLTNLGQNVFNGCSALTTVNGLEYTENVYLPPENAGNGAFYNCTSLTHCGLPHSYQYWSGGAIKADVFYGCSSLTTIIYNGTESEWNAISKNSNWRRNSAVRYVQCTDGTIDLDNNPNTIITYYAPAKLPEVSGSASSAHGVHTDAFTPSFISSAHTFENGVGTIRFASDVTKIGQYAFQTSSAMTGIEIPQSVTTISGYSFYKCYELSSVILPNNLSTLKDGAFGYCYQLTGITIPSGITTISKNMFTEASGLTNVNLPSTLTSIGNRAFTSCSSLTGITIPSGVTFIDEYAFSYCTSLASITIPSGITEINKYTFAYTDNLEDVYLPNSITHIYQGAFNSYRSSTEKNLTFHYDGTMSDWGNITLDSGWIYLQHNLHYSIYVVCSDGTITL